MYTVVLLDDEPWEVLGLERLVPWAELGFQISYKGTDSVDGLQYILENRPDAVITDVRMPGLSGLDLIHEVRKAGLNCEFVIVSGFSEFSFAQQALRDGVLDYCLKPLIAKDMNATVAALKARLGQKREDSRRDSQSEPEQPANDKLIRNESFRVLLDEVNARFAEPLELNDLAARHYLNFTYCSELFHKMTGRTFSRYLIELRVEKAAHMQRETTLPVAEVGQRVGYTDSTHFQKLFKRVNGRTPAQYRRREE